MIDMYYVKLTVATDKAITTIRALSEYFGHNCRTQSDAVNLAIMEMSKNIKKRRVYRGIVIYRYTNIRLTMNSFKAIYFIMKDIKPKGYNKRLTISDAINMAVMETSKKMEKFYKNLRKLLNE